MSEGIPLHLWSDRLEALLERIGGPVQMVRVVHEIASTQDLARASGCGTLVVAGRQTDGRGQRGNHWADTGDDGLAFSVCLPATTRPERSLALAAALEGSLGVFVEEPVCVKPPNDLLIGERKLAGVLVEQSDGLAVIGIGINVRQQSWPDELDGVAISLFEAGADVDRLDVLERVLPGVVSAWESTSA